MLDLTDFITRVKARVTALLPEQWKGKAGERFRETVDTLSDYTKKNVRVGERLREAPDVLWETLKQKSSEALVNAAEEEHKRIEIELARQTLVAKRRQEEASADKAETEARMLRIDEIEKRLAFIEKLRKSGMVCVWSSEGQMTFLKAPLNFNWEDLIKRAITNDELTLASEESVLGSETTGTKQAPPSQEHTAAD